MKRFTLVGVSGFVAPRHLKAIRDTGNELIASMDISDSAGILDSYFPKSEFFTDLNLFKDFLLKNKRESKGVDYLSVCTPNHLHEEHIRVGLSSDVTVICEKPMVLEPENALRLLELEKSFNQRVYNILQLRYHPTILSLKNKKKTHSTTKSEIDLAYITPRGRWYHHSWKGDISKSGGIATNIGIHFFDMLIWIFGTVQNCQVHLHTSERSAGYLELESARVRWFLSIDEKDLPNENRVNQMALRSIKVNGDLINFSSGFSTLHDLNYSAILEGMGYGISDVLPSIELAHYIRTQKPKMRGEIHPLANVYS